MTERSASWTHNPAVLGTSSALTTCWTCPWSSGFKSRAMLVKSLLPVVMLCLDYLLLII